MHGTENSIEEVNENQVFETLQRDPDRRTDRISGACLNSAVDDVGNLQAANDKAIEYRELIEQRLNEIIPPKFGPISLKDNARASAEMREQV